MMKKIISLLLIVCVLATSFAFVGTAEPEKKFVVDGNLDVWYMSNDETPGDDLNYYHFGSLEAYEKASGTATYVDWITQAEVYTAYDDEYVYIYVKVWDDDLFQWKSEYTADGHNSSWADSLEIWFDPDPNSQTHFADGTPRPPKGTLNMMDFPDEKAYKEALEASGEIEDNFCNQTNDLDQGDIQLRLLAYDMVRHDYHNVVKPGYNGVTFGAWVNNTANVCAFYFENEPRLVNEDLDVTVDKGYGIEARFPRESGYKSENYQFNIAVNNHAENSWEHYALAIGQAWWMGFEHANAVRYADENPFFAQDVSAKTVKYTDSEINKASAGGALVDLIAQLPETITSEHEDIVNNLLDQYENLDEMQKGYVRYKNYDVLVEAAEAIGAEVPSEPSVPSVPSEPSDPASPSDPSDPGTPDVVVNYGDLNKDTKEDATDALWALQVSVNKRTLDEEAAKAADVNGDNKIDAADALLILKKSVNKIDKYPVEK